MDQDFAFPACHPTCLIHTSPAPISQPPRHYLVTSLTFFVLVCAQNSRGCCGFCLQSPFTHVVKKFCSPSSFANPENHCPLPNLGAAAIRQQDASLQGRARFPLPRWNVISQMSPQIVGINNPLVPKTDTQETENLDKSIFS
jgi:hypothetical protein